MSWSKVKKGSKPVGWWYHKIMCEIAWVWRYRFGYKYYNYHLDKMLKYHYNLYGETFNFTNKNQKNMKTKRNLSGIYFRAKNEETGKFDNVVFEDLTTEQQDEIMNDRPLEWLKSLSKQLADTINNIGNQFDLIS